MDINEKKIRKSFRMFKSGELENNVQNHRWAVWGLLDCEYGGDYYLVGNRRTVELWTCQGYSSRATDGRCLVSVKNDSEGYAKLAETLENFLDSA